MRYVIDEYYDDIMCIIDDYEHLFSFINKVLPYPHSFIFESVKSKTHEYLTFKGDEGDTIFKIPRRPPHGCTIIEELDFRDGFLFPSRRDDAESVADFLSNCCGISYYSDFENEFLEILDKYDENFSC